MLLAIITIALPQVWRCHSRKPCHAIENKWRGREIILLYDSARSNNTYRTHDRNVSHGLKQLLHPPYNPDLALCDYHLSLHLKKHLALRSTTTKVASK